MQDGDSPFIFEKIGTQLEHVMIDEFQDTSTIQWQNFKVLLDETMSHQDAGNLIVGDVKQSIYRWRSGDWRLLNNIQEQFGDKRLDIKTLDTNYRSAKTSSISIMHSSKLLPKLNIRLSRRIPPRRQNN